MKRLNARGWLALVTGGMLAWNAGLANAQGAAGDGASHGAAYGVAIGTREPEAAALQRYTAAADYSKQFAGRAVLVVRDGAVEFERYDRGWKAETPHPLASGTKSFAGVLAMLAVQDGLLRLDELVCDTLPEWKTDVRKSKVTVEQLLHLTSGIRPNDESLGRQGAGIRGLTRFGGTFGERGRGGAAPEDRFAAALKLPMDGLPGGQFKYGPAHFYVFGAVLQRKLEQSGREEKTYWGYLSERLLKPIGLDLSVARFAPDGKGQPNLPGGGHLTAREWAKFGEFVRNEGAVIAADGSKTQVLKPELLAKCFEGSRPNPAYGLTWWLLNGEPGKQVEIGGAIQNERLRDRMAARLRERAVRLEALKDEQGRMIVVRMAAGAGGQRLYIVPEYKLVVVRFAEMGEEGARYDDLEFLGALLGVKVPARNRD